MVSQALSQYIPNYFVSAWISLVCCINPITTQPNSHVILSPKGWALNFLTHFSRLLDLCITMAVPCQLITPHFFKCHDRSRIHVAETKQFQACSAKCFRDSWERFAFKIGGRCMSAMVAEPPAGCCKDYV